MTYNAADINGHADAERRTGEFAPPTRSWSPAASIGVKDLAGNPVAQSVGGDLHDGRLARRYIRRRPIVCGQSGKRRDQCRTTGSFTITFSEGINAATIESENVLLLKNAVNQRDRHRHLQRRHATASRSRPRSPLEYATSYTIYILAGSDGRAGPGRQRDDVRFCVVVHDLRRAGDFDVCGPRRQRRPRSIVGRGESRRTGRQVHRRRNGTITGVRFYKAPATRATHTGSLWTSTGPIAGDRHVHQRDRQRLADADFATPVAITAGTT